ncbi:telomere length and silencing protein 1 tls1 family member [Holotrichia oblita]|uniref:Telomere length and silencing protein 1 tls1 family member n=1 Tax=Holotrichia oblita TaxID=644536 RepID=A0ACB9TVP3_HOLOL|nr:telomere length and silencing protein 1 tls1 family member [Holotrichia oblita]
MSEEEKIKTEDEPISKKSLFIRKNKKHMRQRVTNEDSNGSDDEDIKSKLDDLKELQNMRKRAHGVSLISLALGKKVSLEEEAVTNDPFAIHAGGLVNMQTIKSGKIVTVDDAYDTGIGTQFSVETNKRDEDEEMMKYIEDQLSKRKGNKTEEDIPISPDIKRVKYCSPEEAALQAVPTHLRESSTKRSEEMLSNQMLSGIPEVDLGIEAKIKNIEATEEAKLRLLWEKQNKKDGPSHFVPSNMAVNFVQHSRFNIDDTPKARHKSDDQVGVVDDRNKSKKDEKATDDYHYERFKKQFRKY